MSKFFVYGLIDPRSGGLRYVGMSSRGMRRPLEHGQPNHLARKKTRCSAWVKSLKNQGLDYEIVVIEEHDNAVLLYEAEQFWIAYYRSVGAFLTNLTDKGPGCRGPRTPRPRETIKGVIRARQNPMEYRSRMSKAKGGKPFRDNAGQIYESVYVAASKLELHPTDIRRVLKGRRRSTGGYVFHYVSSETEVGKK